MARQPRIVGGITPGSCRASGGRRPLRLRGQDHPLTRLTHRHASSGGMFAPAGRRIGVVTAVVAKKKLPRRSGPGGPTAVNAATAACAASAIGSATWYSRVHFRGDVPWHTGMHACKHARMQDFLRFTRQPLRRQRPSAPSDAVLLHGQGGQDQFSWRTADHHASKVSLGVLQRGAIVPAFTPLV